MTELLSLERLTFVERSEELRSCVLFEELFELPAFFRVAELPGANRLRAFLVLGGEFGGELIELRLETECLG